MNKVHIINPKKESRIDSLELDNAISMASNSLKEILTLRADLKAINNSVEYWQKRAELAEKYIVKIASPEQAKEFKKWLKESQEELDKIKWKTK